LEGGRFFSGPFLGRLGGIISHPDFGETKIGKHRGDQTIRFRPKFRKKPKQKNCFSHWPGLAKIPPKGGGHFKKKTPPLGAGGEIKKVGISGGKGNFRVQRIFPWVFPPPPQGGGNCLHPTHSWFTSNRLRVARGDAFFWETFGIFHSKKKTVHGGAFHFFPAFPLKNTGGGIKNQQNKPGGNPGFFQSSKGGAGGEKTRAGIFLGPGDLVKKTKNTILGKGGSFSGGPGGFGAKTLGGGDDFLRGAIGPFF